MEQDSFYLVAVHGGAGFHAKSDTMDAEIKHALRLACKTALHGLKNGDAALTAAEQAIVVLEDEPCLNAGDFGSVGAVSGLKNPVGAARAVLDNARVTDVLGRVPPLTLVSHGAQSFARRHDITCVSPESLVTERSRREWERWKTRLDAALASDLPPSEQTSSGLHDIQDTVGAVAWDTNASLAAGVSSGGLLLKQPGRVGEAALYGAGCWAQDSSARACGVACSVSGTGEYIIRCTVAKTIAESLTTSSADEVHQVLERILGKQFHNVCLSRGNDDPNVGALVVTQIREQDGTLRPRLWCAFTSDSMSVAYASSLDPKPKALILRRSPESSKRTESSLVITTLPLTRI